MTGLQTPWYLITRCMKQKRDTNINSEQILSSHPALPAPWEDLSCFINLCLISLTHKLIINAQIITNLLLMPHTNLCKNYQVLILC